MNMRALDDGRIVLQVKRKEHSAELVIRMDAELKIWISGAANPIQKQFNKRLNIYEVQSVLASYILR
jgi:hypothetical protein